ncbi:hypothetical protein ACOTVL_10660 [Aliarcobacter butzleri]
MLIDDLNEIKKSLETNYKDFKKIKPYTLLKFCKKIILEEQKNFNQKELLGMINLVFDVQISYITFNKFFHSFIVVDNKNKSKKKESRKPKNEIENNEEDIKKDTPKNEVPLKKSENIVSQNTKKVNSGKGGKFANLPDVEPTNVGLIESNNKGRIK